MATYQQAKAYYQKHANKDTIKKIQNFLAVRNSNGSGGVKQTNIGESFYNGDLDGIFGPETYKAILEYQKAVGTNEDGMWGESTNSFHRVLNSTNSPYRNDVSGTSGAYASYMRGVNTGQQASRPRKKWATQNDMYRDIQALKQRYYGQGGEDWFWSEDPSAVQWREFLRSTPQGQDIFNEFYGDAVSRGKKPDKRLMTTEQKQLAYNTGIRDSINRAGRAVAGVAGGLAIPLTIAASPLAGTLALVGGAIGSKIGGNTAENLHTGDTAGYTTADQYYGQIGTAMPADQYHRPIGEIVGGTIGGIAGGALGTYASPGMPRIGYERNSLGNSNKGYYSSRSQPRSADGHFINPSQVYTRPTGVEGRARIAETPGLVGSRQLHVGSLAPNGWQPQSIEFLNYLEGAGGNPAFSPMFAFKKGGILCRNI